MVIFFKGLSIEHAIHTQCWQIQKKNRQSHKNRQFSQNARLNGFARLRTGDLVTLEISLKKYYLNHYFPYIWWATLLTNSSYEQNETYLSGPGKAVSAVLAEDWGGVRVDCGLGHQANCPQILPPARAGHQANCPQILPPPTQLHSGGENWF